MSDLIERQAAIDAISCDITVTGRQNAELVAATIGTFADRIKALPAAHPKFPENWWKTNHGYMWLCPHCGLPVHSDFEECLRCGIKRPSAQQERKKGEWIRTRTMTHDGELYCNICEQEHPEQKIIWNFCPNCGADMRGEKSVND